MDFNVWKVLSSIFCLKLHIATLFCYSCSCVSFLIFFCSLLKCIFNHKTKTNNNLCQEVINFCDVCLQISVRHTHTHSLYLKWFVKWAINNCGFNKHCPTSSSAYNLKKKTLGQQINNNNEWECRSSRTCIALFDRRRFM